MTLLKKLMALLSLTDSALATQQETSSSLTDLPPSQQLPSPVFVVESVEPALQTPDRAGDEALQLEQPPAENESNEGLKDAFSINKPDGFSTSTVKDKPHLNQ